MNELPVEVMDGPKMRALRDDRQRRFAWLMACGERSASAAARQAGYSNVKGGDRVSAHNLMHNQRVMDAILEASRLVLHGLAPMAIRAAKAILENPEHAGHSRMIEALLDRTGFGGKTEHKVTVEHTADTRELEELARRLALETGIDPRRLLGSDEKVIEGEVVK